MMTGIYCVRNGNKFYVGQSQDIEARWKGHTADLLNNKHHSAKLQNAWNKYGHHAFDFEVIELCDIIRLNEVEQYWMDMLEAASRTGYNMCPVAGSCRGIKRSAEYRANMSKSLKGRAVSDVHRQRISTGKAGKTIVRSPEHNEKIRQANMKYWSSPEAQQRRKNPSRCSQFYTQHTDDVSAIVTHWADLPSSTGDEKLCTCSMCACNNLQRIMGAQ
jgi:group I intron endonuclease